MSKYTFLLVVLLSMLAVVNLGCPPNPSGPTLGVVWSYTPDKDAIWGKTIEKTQDGGFIVGGGDSAYKMYALKLDANGYKEWEVTPTRITPDSNQSNLWRSVARDVQETADGNFIMLGQGHVWQDGLSEQSYVLVKLDPNGEEIWGYAYGPRNPNYPTHYCGPNDPAALAITDEGGYVALGCSYLGPYLSSILQTDAEGNEELVQVIDSPNDGDYPETIEAGQGTADGGYVMAGYTEGPAGYAALIIKVDDAGGWEWTQKYQFTELDYGVLAHSITQLSDGDYIVGGELCNHINKSQYFGSWLARLNSSGGVEWSRQYNSDNAVQVVNAIKETPDGCFLAGDTSHMGNMTLVKFTGAGNILWRYEMEGFPGKHVQDIVVTDDGGCVVVGSGGTGGPTAVVKIKNVYVPAL